MHSKEYYRFYSDWRPCLLADKDCSEGSVVRTVACDLLAKNQVAVAVIKQVSEVSEEMVAQLTPKLLSIPKRDRIMSDIDEESDVVMPIESGPSVEDDQQPQDSQNLLSLLEDNEKISHLFRCARVEGLDTVEGLLLFGKKKKCKS